MRGNITGFAMVMALVTMGCDSTPDGSEDKLVEVEANTLGIDFLEVHHSASADESVLEIRGLAMSGAEVARATLRTGWVRYSYTDDPMDAPPSAGRELVVAGGGTEHRHVSPDRDPHVAPAPRAPQLATFVRLRGVAAELDAEAGLRFPAEEVAFQMYTCSACDDRFFPTNVAASSECGMEVGSVNNQIASSEHLIAAGSNAGKIAFSYYGPSCTRSSGAGCSDTDTGSNACYFGPCGSHRDPSGTGTGKVFHPSWGDSPVCGWDNNISNYPEAYTDQTLWGGQGASCTCTGCTNGVPTPAGCSYPTSIEYVGGGA